MCGRLAQLVERRANYANVAGSIPVLATSVLLVSIVVSIPACHAGDRGSIPRRGALFQNLSFKFLCILYLELFNFLP